MKTKLENFAVNAVLGTTLVLIVGLATVHTWALSKRFKNE